jgi:hypothetical protein
VPVLFDQVLPAGDIPDREDVPLWRDTRSRPLHRQWGGATYEVRNHLDGCIVACRTAEPTAVNYPLSQEAEYAFYRALAYTVFAGAAISKGWDADNRAAAGAEPGGDRWPRPGSATVCRASPSTHLGRSPPRRSQHPLPFAV